MHYPSFTVAGHRGAMAHAPENSRQSFLLAEDAGASEIELDVRCTRDGTLIVLHDDTLDRVAASADGRGLGPVADLDFSTVRTVTLDSGEPPLTLAEAFEITRITIQVEIKELRAVEALGAFMRRHPEFAERTIFTTFDPESLYAIARAVPDVPRGIIVPEYPKAAAQRSAIDDLLRRAGADIFHCGWNGLTRQVVDKFHAEGYGVRGWPVREPDDMLRAVELGVDGITSDDPSVAWAWHRECRRYHEAHAGS